MEEEEEEEKEEEDFPLQMIWNLWGTYMRQDVVHQGLEALGCLYDNQTYLLL
jgi:hypothetical protein